MRMPNSCARWLTAYASTLYKPSAASSSDTPPSTLSSAAATFCAYSEPAIISVELHHLGDAGVRVDRGRLAADRGRSIRARGPTVRMKKAVQNSPPCRWRYGR